MRMLINTLRVALLVTTCSALLYESRECKKSIEGHEYMGTVDVTRDGTQCQRWDEQFPHNHSITENMLPDRNFGGSSNYCRNPDAKARGPWCYTTDPGVEWDFCNITNCESFADCGADCKPSATCTTSSTGVEYVGKRGITTSGRPCQRWDRQYPHQHSYSDVDFPDDSMSDSENFCRNPAGDQRGTWCYTMDRTVEWEYCDIPVCTDCKHEDDGRGYAGVVGTTISGRNCQRWDSQTPHPHNFTSADFFPDASLDDAAYYCRNPDKKTGGVWCYTTDPSVEWEYCDVPNCLQECPEKDRLGRRTVKHILQIGVDGLHHDCWLNASGGVPNFHRLMQEGAYSLDMARTDMYTFSAPGWSCQLCGMDIEHTGCTSNGWSPTWMDYPNPVTPITGNEYPLPCVHLHLKGLDSNTQTASFLNWPWIRWLGGRGTPGSTDVEHTCEGLLLTIYQCDEYIANQTAAYMEEVVRSSSSSYTFIHLDGIDWSGHTFRWCSNQYLNYINTIDTLLGRLLDSVEGEDVLVLLSSDHGGHDFDHGAAIDSDLYIPLFLKGPGVKAGYEMQNPVRNIDMVPTLVWAMGHQQNPHWTGSVLYEAFES